MILKYEPSIQSHNRLITKTKWIIIKKLKQKWLKLNFWALKYIAINNITIGIHKITEEHKSWSLQINYIKNISVYFCKPYVHDKLTMTYLFFNQLKNDNNANNLGSVAIQYW